MPRSVLLMEAAKRKAKLAAACWQIRSYDRIVGGVEIRARVLEKSRMICLLTKYFKTSMPDSQDQDPDLTWACYLSLGFSNSGFSGKKPGCKNPGFWAGPTALFDFLLKNPGLHEEPGF